MLQSTTHLESLIVESTCNHRSAILSKICNTSYFLHFEKLRPSQLGFVQTTLTLQFDVWFKAIRLCFNTPSPTTPPFIIFYTRGQVRNQQCCLTQTTSILCTIYTVKTLVRVWFTIQSTSLPAIAIWLTRE